MDELNGRLFEAGLEERTWSTFRADGFSGPVAGLIMHGDNPPCCGAPLGGLGTGCIDLDPRGTFGFSTLFPTRRRQPDSRYQVAFREAALNRPFLGASFGGETLVCATAETLAGGRIVACVEPGMNRELLEEDTWRDAWTPHAPPVQGVRPVDAIEYWGHYPVVDAEFLATDYPVSIGLRAWAPFIPGDSIASNTPAAVFEVRVRNTTDRSQSGLVAFSFDGLDPDVLERSLEFSSRPFNGERAEGVSVSADDRTGYVLAAIDVPAVEISGGLGSTPTGWAALARGAAARPALGDDASAAVTVPVALQPRESTVVRFVLAWFAPTWEGGRHRDIAGFERWDIGPYPPPGRDSETGHVYTAYYTERFVDAENVATYLSSEHDQLLKRVLSWQGALYDVDYEPWLMDALLNSLSVITEDSYWAAYDENIGEWAQKAGAFGLVESPRGCAIMGCVVSNWYGDLPLTYFFPDLEEAIIANYAAFVRPDGAVPFLFPNGDFIKPTYEWLLPLNGICFIGILDRLWLRTRDQTLVERFYPVVKANTIFTINLQPPPNGVVGVHRVGTGQEWWEHTPVQGLVTHVAGLRLASLQIAARMARAVGDDSFAAQCDRWFSEGKELAERTVWMEDAGSYMFFRDEERGAESDDILSSQLDGEWSSRSHGFDGVFAADRVRRTLATIRDACVGDFAVSGFATREGTAEAHSSITFSRDGEPMDTPYGTFTAETDIIGMTYMYAGDRDLGLEIVRRNADNIIRLQGHGWDLPNMVRGDNGLRNFGTDYFQKLSIWGVPAALEGQPIDAPCRDGGLVAKVLAAAQP